jgi:hypothetical protein
MFRKFSDFAIWVALGLVLALVPLACSSDDTTPSDGAASDAMTKS